MGRIISRQLNNLKPLTSAQNADGVRHPWRGLGPGAMVNGACDEEMREGLGADKKVNRAERDEDPLTRLTGCVVL